MGLSHPHSGLMPSSSDSGNMPPHPSHAVFLNEILSQPECLRTLLSRPLTDFTWFQASIKQVVALAEGSSFNALTMAKPFIESALGITLNIYTSSTWEVYQACNPTALEDPSTGLLLLSQSGNTGCLVNAWDAANETISHLKEKTVLVTNTPSGQLQSRARHVFNIAVGKEESIPATKTVTGSLLALLLWSTYQGLQAHPNNHTLQKQLQALQSLPKKIQTWLEESQDILETLCQQLSSTDEFVILTQGFMSLALPEIQLKLIEILGNQVHIDDMEGFKHGHKVLLGRMKTHPMTAIYIAPAADKASIFYADLEQHFMSREKTMWIEAPRIILLQAKNTSPAPLALQALLKPTLIPTPALDNSVNDFFFILATFQLLGYGLAKTRQISLNSEALSKYVADSKI